MIATMGAALQGQSIVNIMAIWLTWVFTVFSFTLNWQAAGIASPIWRGHYRRIAYLSLVYMVAYLILIFGPFSITDWFFTVKYIGLLLVWPIVWCGPAIIRIRSASILVSQTADEVLQTIKKEIGEGGFK